MKYFDSIKERLSLLLPMWFLIMLVAIWSVIIQDGLRRMYQEKESVYYYITTMNENYTQNLRKDESHQYR